MSLVVRVITLFLTCPRHGVMSPPRGRQLGIIRYIAMYRIVAVSISLISWDIDFQVLFFLKVFVGEMKGDVETCAKRSETRSAEEIAAVSRNYIQMNIV